MERRVRVFLNAMSGSGGIDGRLLTAKFVALGCGCDVTELSSETDLDALARRDPVGVAFVAAGGDGTVSAVAQMVVGTERRMAVLPMGTLNHFAKDLGLPADLDAAIAIAAGDTTRRVDAVEVNGRVFVNNSSVGAYPLMVLDRERMKKTGFNKWLSLTVASAKTFIVMWRMRVEVDVDGVRKGCKTPFVFVGNNEYCLDRFKLGNREHLDRGELAVYFAHGVGRWGVMKMALATLAGRVKQDPGYEEMKGREVTLWVRRRRPRVSLDGEVRRLRSPLVYRMRPRALTVLCSAEEVR